MRSVLVGMVLITASGQGWAQTSLTIYNDGRVLVRRPVPLAVSAGISTHRVALGPLDPATLFALDSGVAVLSASYDAALDEATTIRRAVGQSLRFVAGKGDTITATVLGADPERYRLADGKVVFQRPGLPLFPAELVLVEPSLSLSVRAAGSRPSLRLGYFTQGASWQAGYAVLLGRGGTAQVSGHATIPSTTMRERDVEVQLLAGLVGRARPRPPMPIMARAEVAQEVTAAAVEEEIGEAHLYSVPGRVNLEPGVTATVALFDPATAPWERAYVVPGQLNFFGPLQQYGTEPARVPVQVWYTLKRGARTPFGDLPLPGGTWRLYQADEGNRQQLIGEASAGHTAAGTDVRLQAGEAFDLTATRVQLSYSTRRDSLRTIGTADYRVTIRSAKDSAVTVDVLEERGGEWSVVSSSVPAERLSSTRARFRVRVPARGETVLTYRVRAIW